jgi:hypothetical protein
VTVTDRIGGYALAAVPLCSWVNGVATRKPDGTVVIGGQAVADSSKARSAVARQTALNVCLLETTLRNRQVLDIRALDGSLL